MDPVPVSHRVSPMDRGRPDRLDVRNLHPVPLEGCPRAYEPRLDSVHNPAHPWEQRRGPCSVQGADGREGGLA